MEIESKTFEAPRPRLTRFLHGLLTHRIGGYFAIVAVVLFVSFIAGIAIGSSPVPAAIVARVLAFHILPEGWFGIGVIGRPIRDIVWLVFTTRDLVSAFG